MRKPPLHEADICVGHPCPYHGPSNHLMKNWPKTQRMDAFAFGLVERLCPHGTGHPDPDSVEWLESLANTRNKGSWGIHGCDGCCGGLN